MQETLVSFFLFKNLQSIWWSISNTEIPTNEIRTELLKGPFYSRCLQLYWCMVDFCTFQSMTHVDDGMQILVLVLLQKYSTKYCPWGVSVDLDINGGSSESNFSVGWLQRASFRPNDTDEWTSVQTEGTFFFISLRRWTAVRPLLGMNLQKYDVRPRNDCSSFSCLVAKMVEQWLLLEGWMKHHVLWWHVLDMWSDCKRSTSAAWILSLCWKHWKIFVRYS